MSNPHRPASAWLTQLQRAKAESTSSAKPKTTIQDLIERANAMGAEGEPSRPESALIPTSPRSVEACFRLGLDPLDLVYRPLSYFKRPGELQELTAKRHAHHEALRQERLAALVEERKKLIDGGGELGGGAPGATGGHPGGGSGGGAAPNSAATSAMIEKEKHKLEVLKRRQERDIQQMLQYEVTRKQLLDKQQKKIEAMEARAAELRRQKAEHGRQWAVAQRERELAKLAEEQERDREALRIAAERYRRKRELHRKEAEDARQRKKEAFQREVERREKVEESRRETERILAAQEAEVKARKAEMERRDKERLERMEKEAEERAAANAIKKKKAEERIASALSQNEAILLQRRADFETREAASEVRRREMDEERRAADERKRTEEERQQAERRGKYELSLQREEERKQDIKSRAAHKQEVLDGADEARHSANSQRRVDRELFNGLRRDKVDAIQKMQAYQRQLLLEKIMEENEKTARLLEQRRAIQEQRKAANMAASMHRNKVASLMESMRSIKNIEKMAPNGRIDAAMVASQLASL